MTVLKFQMDTEHISADSVTHSRVVDVIENLWGPGS